MTKYILDPNKQNILITGASGFIGRHLSNRLKEEYNIFNIVSKKSRAGISNKIIMDLTKQRNVKLYFKQFREKYKIHIIIHLAGKLASVNGIEEMYILYDNLKITESIVEIAKLLKPEKIINFSSIAVYPNDYGTYGEKSEIKTSMNSDCLYGLSKFCSENILDFMLRKEKIIISHLRVSQVYGKGMRKDRVIPVMLKELEERNTITVFGNGERVSNFIRIENLLNTLDTFIKKDLNGIFNIGDENLSYLQLAQRFIKQNGDKKSKIIKQSTGSKARFYLDTTKIGGAIPTDRK